MNFFKKLRTSRIGMLILLGVLLLVTGIIWFSLQFSGKNRLITGIDIRINPEQGVYFISNQDVSNLITRATGNPIGKSLGNVSIVKIESILRKLPCVQSAQVFVSMEGKLRIQITQRIPLLRIQNTYGETYYLDSTGHKIPVLGNRSPDVLIANGIISEKYNDSNSAHSPILKDLLKVTRFILSDSMWNAQFEQCYVDNLGDIILVPRVGKHSIVIGTAEDIEEKMANLLVFYDKALRNLGWNRYKEINLKYRGQIVGVKSGEQIEHIENENVQKPQH
jgi:cell division protein FtsQ